MAKSAPKVKQNAKAKAKAEDEAKAAKKDQDTQKAKLTLGKSARDEDDEEEDEEEDETDGTQGDPNVFDEEDDEEVISQDEDEDFEELVTQDDIDKGKVDPVKADIRNAGSVDDSDAKGKGKRDTPAVRSKNEDRDVEEVDEADSKSQDREKPTQIRLTRRVGVGTRIGSWSWADAVGEEGYVDDVVTVPYFAAVHLSGIGVAIPFDNSIPHFSSIRTNTRPSSTKFLR